MHLDWQMVLIYALSGVVLLVVLWPSVKVGQRFLKRWGVKDPTEEQGVLARQYLLHRRMLYPPLFMAAPFVTDGNNFWPPLILALLLAEIIGTLRPVRGPRSATLTRRNWGDLVPRWAVILMLALGALAVVIAVATRFAQQWGREVLSTNLPTSIPADDIYARVTDSRWLVVIITVVLATAAVLGIVWLAVRRGSIADLRVDAALRTRSARVAVGIGIAFMATSVVEANRPFSVLRGTHWPVPAPWLLAGTSSLEALSLPMLLICVAGWIWVANPSPKMPYIQSVA
ncbi:hypothetical protein LWC34_07145 [Kibdelosporangium philippinense]|uniref:Uncharacterized protein n=1 Tax=Kibdelosporangium philippinense TaxID=211113 RepID=A0ABS8Z9T4_9PSEU|nr:hypothetical protein [Kibdelosporangium philippinense]MCE7002607.1 hypothetical protein [Kibdelosporangium philippinense]